MSGFVKIPRALRDHPLGGDPEALAVFIHLVINAAYQDQEVVFNGEKLPLKRGQLIYGRTSYAQKIGLTESAIRRVMRRLEKWRLIGSQTTKRFSVITLLASDLWQDNDLANGTKKNITSNINNIKTQEDAKKPSLPEITNFIKAKKLSVDAEDFFNYYDSRGWMFPSGQKIITWQSLVYSWSKREAAKAKPETSWEVVK